MKINNGKERDILKKRDKLYLKVICLVIVFVLFGCSFAETSGMRVKVKIPSFPVTVNENTIDSSKMRYPLIVYNDITYFPLTWSWSRELGIVTGYTEEEGLYIANYTSYNRTEMEEVDLSGNYKMDAVYLAIVPNYPVHINGRLIDNSVEEYPLLNFQGITYFPLTWRYVIEEFNWGMSWNEENGSRLNSESSVIECTPGEKYEKVSLYTLYEYKDHSIIREVRNIWTVGKEADVYGEYKHHKERREDSYYKLDYSSKRVTEIDFVKSSEPIYTSGSVRSEGVEELFNVQNNLVYYHGSNQPLLSYKELNEHSVSRVNAYKFSVNGMDIYDISVYFCSDDGSEIPPPYTPFESFVFIDDGNGVLQKINSWPTSHSISAVYPFKGDGVYLCSRGRHFGSARLNNGRGWVTKIKSDLTEINLNKQWKDWNSIYAFGMDRLGNLYLKNTWFPSYDFPNQFNGRVSLVNDGFFILNPEGELSKMYPFIESTNEIVTPDGKIYLDARWINSIICLPTGEKVQIE